MGNCKRFDRRKRNISAVAAGNFSLVYWRVRAARVEIDHFQTARKRLSAISPASCLARIRIKRRRLAIAFHSRNSPIPAAKGCAAACESRHERKRDSNASISCPCGTAYRTVRKIRTKSSSHRTKFNWSIRHNRVASDYRYVAVASNCRKSFPDATACGRATQDGNAMSDLLYFDNVDVGQVWESPARTVTETDVVNFACMTGDYTALHVDHQYAETTPYRQPIAHGLLGLSLLAGLSSRFPNMATAAFVSVRDWKFLKPIYFGDTVHVVTEVIEKRRHGRKRGEVIWHRQLVNQGGQVVQSGVFETLVDVAQPRRATLEPADAMEHRDVIRHPAIEVA